MSPFDRQSSRGHPGGQVTDPAHDGRIANRVTGDMVRAAHASLRMAGYPEITGAMVRTALEAAWDARPDQARAA